MAWLARVRFGRVWQGMAGYGTAWHGVVTFTKEIKWLAKHSFHC